MMFALWSAIAVAAGFLIYLFVRKLGQARISAA